MIEESKDNNEIPLLAGQRPDGELVFEQVTVSPLEEPNCYCLSASPAFSKGLAKGDKIRLLNAGHFEVIKHSGNLCIRVFAKEGIDQLRKNLQSAIEKFEGSLDFQNDRMLVYSVPVIKGFTSIEEVFNQALPDSDQATWMYGNVYDPIDGTTPLNWWQELLLN